MKTQPPEWMQEAARTNPVVGAYLRIWSIGEPDRAAFWEVVAKELAGQFAALEKLAFDKLANRLPAPLADFVDHREAACVQRWPGCGNDLHDPRCCRFPKSCSAGRR